MQEKKNMSSFLIKNMYFFEVGVDRSVGKDFNIYEALGSMPSIDRW